MENVIRAAIEDALATLGITDVEFGVEHPSELAHGDYASNAALVAANVAGGNPRALAEQIVAELTEQIEYVERIEVAGPGFINFHLAREFFTEELHRARELREDWGKNETLNGATVLVEYTDPNPFKEFHVGHLFTNAVGESIARLFMMGGANTKRVNYQGDVGLHVACALYGMQQLGFAGARDFSARELGRAYALGAAAYKEDEDAQREITTINKAVYERSDETINALYDKGHEVSLAYFEGIYTMLGTAFDHYFFESEAGPRGKELVLMHPEIFPESEGARVFKGEEHGLHTRVFINSEGLPTYEAKELALAKLKEETAGPHDRSVVVTANEINEYFKVLRMAMHAVYPELAEKTEHIGHGMVRLADGKMSSRTGDVIAATDFIDEVAAAAKQKMADSSIEHADDDVVARDIAIAAIKYAILKSNIAQDSIFDKEQALSFEGDSGPYLQYTVARINSVLEKATNAGVIPSLSHAPERAYEVERILYRFPEVVADALATREPHLVAGHLIELAGAFNTFYATERIADADDTYAPYKAALADAVRVTLTNGLWILGIRAPERL